MVERNEVRDFPQHTVPAPVFAPVPAEVNGTYTADVNEKCLVCCEKLLLSLPSVK